MERRTHLAHLDPQPFQQLRLTCQRLVLRTHFCQLLLRTLSFRARRAAFAPQLVEILLALPDTLVAYSHVGLMARKDGEGG